MRENRLSGSMRGGARRSLAFGLSIRRLRLLYTVRPAMSCSRRRQILLLRGTPFCQPPAFAAALGATSCGSLAPS